MNSPFQTLTSPSFWATYLRMPLTLQTTEVLTNDLSDFRFIRFHMLCSGNMLAITVDNSFHGDVKMDGAQYLSSKANHSGLGLHNIEIIANKYEGGVEFTHDSQVFHSSVMLVL